MTDGSPYSHYKQAAAPPASLMGKIVTALGGKALQKGWSAGRGAFKAGPTSFGTSVPAGAGMAERTAAMTQGNALMAQILAAKGGVGARLTGARIKTPDSIAGHGPTASAATMDDLAGMRFSMPGGNYSPAAVQGFMDKMKGLGVTFGEGASKTLVKPGYHGVNIKGHMPGTTGQSGMPVEFQLTPRRMVGTNQVDHSTSYKPQESGVNPIVAQLGYRPAIRYYSNTVSPFVSASTRAAHVAGLAIPAGAAGYGAYALANAGGTPQIPAEGGYAAAPPATSPGLPPEQAQPSYASAAPVAPGPAF